MLILISRLQLTCSKLSTFKEVTCHLGHFVTCTTIGYAIRHCPITGHFPTFTMVYTQLVQIVRSTLNFLFLPHVLFYIGMHWPFFYCFPLCIMSIYLFLFYLQSTSIYISFSIFSLSIPFSLDVLYMYCACDLLPQRWGKVNNNFMWQYHRDTLQLVMCCQFCSLQISCFLTCLYMVTKLPFSFKTVNRVRYLRYQPRILLFPICK